MSIFKHINSFKDERQSRNIFVGSLLVILSTLLIVVCMPRGENNQTPFEKDKPWHYGTVIAKYAFPVYKSEEALNEEKDSLMQSFQPYYAYDAEVEKTNLAKFETDFAANMHDVPASTKAIITDRLHRLYQAGIMDTHSYNKMAKADTTAVIRVVSGKNAESIVLNCIYSTMAAYERLLSDEALAPERPALQHLNLNNYIEPNLVYDKQRSEMAMNDLLSGVAVAMGTFQAGQKIVSDGEIVSDYTYQALLSYERMVSSKNAEEHLSNRIVSETLYVFILMLTFTVYLLLFRSDYFDKVRNVTMIYSLIVIFPILVSFMMQHSFFHFTIYVLPFALVPMFVRVFMDSRTANMANLTMVLICTIIVKFQIEFIFVQTIAGLVTIYSLRQMNSRGHVFYTALLVFLTMCVCYNVLKLFGTINEFHVDRDMISHFGISCVLLLLAYPLMYLIEKGFGFTSDITLVELSNTSSGLLRTLSEVAPGTFQHSIMVANLAAAVANRIGAKSNLVRTGALYHDIGKMVSPVFYTENQQGGINPHDNLTDKESARIIIEHVANGIKIAEEHNLPTDIVEFIRTSHGRSMCKYFYINYQNEHPDEIVDKEIFTYPGPNPSTKEQAILMMCDTVEAAARSLKEYSNEIITTLVNKLIDTQVAEGCYHECKITFYDIAVAKQTLIASLGKTYHTRIQYPTARRPEPTAKA